MADLKRYRDKRDLAQTPEPAGADTPQRAVPPAASRAFVVQQHAARNLHWDLRLEIDGVLVSWAVPKGPTLDPSEKRFAARTEDHPLEYQTFEGLIPEGNYGAGAMIVWDRGSYRTVKGTSPARDLDDGKLDLLFDGHKLRGRFALVRMKGEDGKSWLLLRKGDPPEDEEPISDRLPTSVFSGLTVQELSERRSHDETIRTRAAALGAPRREPEPSKLRPMLAATADEAFSRDGWLFELKYDGMRALASRTEGGDVTLRSRSGRDVTDLYPEIARALSLIPLEAFVVDGEIVAHDDLMRPSFERLQGRMHVRDSEAIGRAQIETPVFFYAFDLLSAAGYDLRRQGLRERKKLLAAFIPSVPSVGQVRFVDHIERDGQALYEAAAASGYEGVMAKRADARYDTGRRSQDWLKLKVPHSSPLVVVGWQKGKGSRERLGALRLAWYRDEALCYAGNVGSGLDDAVIDWLLAQLEPLVVDAPAFEGAPASQARGVFYVRPEIVALVSYTEVTSAGNLRHPVLQSIETTHSPIECQAPIDRAAAAEAVEPPRPPEPTLRFTRLDKVFWPEDGYTKGDLVAYYEAAWPWIAPYLKDRPVVLARYPDGIDGKSFFQQNVPDWTPPWAQHEEIDGTDFFICNDMRTLLHVVNSGAIPLHVWSARLGSLDHPDWIVLDLDPKGAPLTDVVKIARHTHKLLETLEVPHFVKTSGQDGLHVLVPLAAQLTHDEARALSEAIARIVAAELPEIATIARPIAARGDRVYVDYLQNGRGKLIAAPFSVRPRPGAPVSTPLAWSQVTARLDPMRWTIRTTLRHIEKAGDPLAKLLTSEARVGEWLDRLAQRLA